MDISPEVLAEWRDRHVLGRISLGWLHDHADPGDANPVVTAIGLLRETRLPAGDGLLSSDT